MGMQLIFVVETNKSCNSDWIYIKETIEQFYSYERTQIKFTPIYMDGKGNYIKKQKEVEKKIKQYSATSDKNQSRVIYCFDCDEYDRKQEDLNFLNDAKLFCQNAGYEFVWFCKDIEQVYIGKQVDDSMKKKEATNFKASQFIKSVNKKSLSEKLYRIKTSNILNILNGYSVLIQK